MKGKQQTGDRNIIQFTVPAVGAKLGTTESAVGLNEGAV